VNIEKLIKIQNIKKNYNGRRNKEFDVECI
jgi:hypothetical protein